MKTPIAKVLILCAHEPTLDPRIRWEAEWAARRFEVTVLGFNRDQWDGAPLPEQENLGHYRLVRLKRNVVGARHFFWGLKDVMPRRTLAGIGIVLALLWPILFSAEVALRLVSGALRWLWRGARRLLTLAPLFQLLRGLDFPHSTWRWTTRLRHVVGMLQVQFGSATALFGRYLDDLPEKPEIVHCNDLDTLLVGALAKQRYGCRVIFDAHEFYPHSDPSGAWFEILFFSLIERLLIHHADAVVTVSPPLAEAMRAAYRLKRVHAVPNAELWRDDRPPPRAGCEMDRLAAGRVKFLFQGRFSPGRGIGELVEAWLRVDGSRAALFLRGPDNIWREQVVERAARLGLLDHSVFFLDPVTEEELIPAAAEADVGVIPYQPVVINNRLCCPNKLSQYLHAGLMVIANDLPYVNAVLAEAGAGLAYDERDPGSLAAAVMCIVEDPALLARGRANALHFARESFNWQAHGVIFDALYEGREIPAANAAGLPRAVASGDASRAAGPIRPGLPS